jgi:hypothetical protein
MCNRFQFENKSVAVMLIDDGLMSTNASLVLMKELLDTEQVSWLMLMNDAFMSMNDAFVRMSDALVRMNASFMRTKRTAGYRLQGTGYRVRVTGCGALSFQSAQERGSWDPLKVLWGMVCRADNPPRFQASNGQRLDQEQSEGRTVRRFWFGQFPCRGPRTDLRFPNA